MLSNYSIKRICKTKAPFAYYIDNEHLAIALMARAAFHDTVYTEKDVQLIKFFLDNRELFPDLFSDSDNTGLLDQYTIEAICKDTMSMPFDHEVESNIRVYAAMVKNFRGIKYTTGDIELINFLYWNRDLYPELFKKEK